MDVRGLAMVADSGRGGGEEALFKSNTNEIVPERTSDADALSGNAFCADAYYITKFLALPTSLPTPDEESVAIFSCLSTFVNAPPSGFEDSPIELIKVEGIYRHLDEDPSKLGRNEGALQRNETSDRLEFPQKLPAAKDTSRLNSGEGDTSMAVAALHNSMGNSKQLMTEITQFLRVNASSSKLPIAAAKRTRAASSMSTQTDCPTEAASFKQHLMNQQPSDPSIVKSSIQRNDARKAASLVSLEMRPQLFEWPERRLPFEAELCDQMIENSLRESVDLQSISDVRKTILPGPEILEPMSRNRDAQKRINAGTEIPSESTVPTEFLQTDLPAPEIAFIGAVHSNAPNESLISSSETVHDVSISIRKGLNTGVHLTANQKFKSDNEVPVDQAFPFSRGLQAQNEIDEKTYLAAYPSVPSDKGTNREAEGFLINEVGDSKKLSSNYTIDLIPPPAEFATDEEIHTNASQSNYQSVVGKGQQRSIHETTDIALYPTNDPASISTAGTPDLSAMIGLSDASNGFKASNNSRSLMRPKLPPPAPPSRLDNRRVGSFKGGVEGSVPSAVSRRARDNVDDTVDRISLCQYGRDTAALTMLRTETVAIRVKASSTADLVEAIGLSPRFPVRPEPPRRSCSIPRKPSTHSLSDWVRVDPDGSSDDQKQSPDVRVSAHLSGASTMSLRNDSLRSSSIKVFGGESGRSDQRIKPTAQIRPNAIRAISSSVCIGAKYFPNVESLIQQYSQPDASDSTTEEFKTAGKAASKIGSKSSSGSTSKFGTLRGRLRDYVNASSTKKQTFSYSGSIRTLSHTKHGSKTIKTTQTSSTWEPKPTDYQRDEEEAPPESSSDIKPNYISSYLSFAGPKPYTPPRTISSLITKTEDQPNLTSTFRTFVGSRIESVSSLASDKDSLAKFRTEATGSQSLTGSPSSSGSPPDSKTEMINEWLKSRSVDCNSPSLDSESQSPTKLQSSRTESGPDEEPFFRENDPTSSVFTREPPSKMSTFRTSGSISVNSSVVPDIVTSPGNSRRPVFPGVITFPGITDRSAIPCVQKDHSKSLPRNVHGRSRNLSESEDRATVRGHCSFSRSPLGSKSSKEFDKGVDNRSNGMKEFPAESAFEAADCIVTDLVQKLRSTFSEETIRAQDLESSKERLVGLTRQFVTDSQNLVSSATQNRDQLVQSVTASSETLSRIVDHCLGTASAMGPTSQAVILNNRVMDLTGAYKATMIAARVAVGKPLNCPEMKGLMKQATSLAAILSSLIKLLNRL